MTTKPYVPVSDEERDFLAAYDPSGFPSIALTVDMLVFTIRAGRLAVLLIERGGFPYKGSWALPGGFVNPDESADEAAARELFEETNITVGDEFHLEQLKTYTTPGRDPRMRVVSTSYFALVPDLPSPTGGDDASQARWWAVEDLGLEGNCTEDSPALAFDHATIIRDGLERVRAKIEYSPLATKFLESSFTLADLRRVYEAVWNEPLHPANFRRKVLSTPGFVKALGNKGESKTGGRTAALYEEGNASLLHPALLRRTVNTEEGDDE